MTTQTPVHMTDRRLLIARVLWWTLAVGHLALLLVSLPNFYARVSTLTIEPYRLGERVIYDNARAIKQAQERGVSPQTNAAFEIALVLIQVGVYYFLTALIAWRTTNGFGWFTAFVLLFMAVGSVMEMFVGVARPFPYANVLVEIPGYLVWPAWIIWMYLFPNGQAVPRWSARPMKGLMTFFGGLQILSLMTVLGVLPALPVNIETFAANTLGPILVLPIFGIILYSQVIRYRHISTLMERQQTKWFLFGIGVFIGTTAMIISLPVSFQASALSQNIQDIVFLLFPISVALAILRYRLFDVDLIIRRTLQYTLLTGLLALVYFGFVITFQGVFSSISNQQSKMASSPIFIVLSTLAIAALFNPLRNRVQDFIDRRFYRKKYNAEQALAQFATIARDEVDMDKLTTALIVVVKETMQPESVSLMLIQKENK